MTHRNSGYVTPVGSWSNVTSDVVSGWPNKWQRYSGYFDLTVGNTTRIGESGASPKNEVNAAIPHLLFQSSNDTNIDYYFDALQFEEVTGTIREASNFKEPSLESELSLTRQIPDGKIVTHYGPEYGSNPYYGPEPHYLPKLNLDGNRVYNPEPHGDRWINTSNNRIEFVYQQNTTNFTAQTIFWHPENSKFVFSGPNANASGWYSTENEKSQTAFVSATSAQVRADQAYSDAAISQAAADREILAFFSSVTSVPKSTGNGDIWIITDYPVNSDGSANIDSIYIANLTSTVPPAINDTSSVRYWNPAPNNAIGLTYLESFASGVSGTFDRSSNRMPRGYSTFDERVADYNLIDDNMTTAQVVAAHKQDLPYPIITSGDGSVPADGNELYIDLDIDSGVFGKRSLKANTGKKTTKGSWVERYATFANTTAPSTRGHYDKWGIPIERGKRWILSWYVKANTVSLDTDTHAGSENAGTIFDLFLANSTNHVGYTNRGFTTLSTQTTHDIITANTWQRNFVIFDFNASDLEIVYENGGSSITSNAEINSIIPFLYVTANASHGDITYWVDSIQIEEVSNNIVTPSAFKEPSPGTSIVFGRTITDGKIVTRYEQQYGNFGPEPHFTPKGRLPNPEPHGDSWHNLSNNNIIFRYHQNTSNHTAQTIFYPLYNSDGSSIALETEANSGWYSTEDPRAQTAMLGFESALSKAALSQAAADREIISFFEPSTNTNVTATGNGDIWVQTDNILNTDGSPNTYSIFVAFAAGATGIGAGKWVQSPYNAIGQGFVKTLAASVGTNRLPRGYSTFDVPLSDYIIGDFTNDNDTIPYPLRPHGAQADGPAHSAVINTTSGYIGTSSLQASANNDGWVDFANGGIFYRHPYNNTRFAIDIPRGKKWIFSYYTKTNNSITTADRAFVFMRDKDSPSANGSSVTGGSGIFSANNTWERRWFSFDLSNTTHDVSDYQVVTGSETGRGISSTDNGTVTDHNHGPDKLITGTTPYAANVNSIILRVDALETGSTEPDEGVTVWYDGLQLEESIGGRLTPGPFQEPSNSKDSDFSRAIADGKIITHYVPNSGNPNYWGPDPQYTPQGAWNPTPYGDIWVDTANNNLLFRYYQNVTNFSSNSVFHANNVDHLNTSDASGWYSTEDLRTSSLETTTETLTTSVDKALADAAFALTASDAEILVFFEPSSNAIMRQDPFGYGSNVGPATGNGDIWINIDQVYTPDGKQNTASILRANLHPGIGWESSPENAIGRAFLDQFTTVGVKNWIPSGYSKWDEDSSEYIISNDAAG